MKYWADKVSDLRWVVSSKCESGDWPSLVKRAIGSQYSWELEPRPPHIRGSVVMVVLVFQRQCKYNTYAFVMNCYWKEIWYAGNSHWGGDLPGNVCSLPCQWYSWNSMLEECDQLNGISQRSQTFWPTGCTEVAYKITVGHCRSLSVTVVYIHYILLESSSGYQSIWSYQYSLWLSSLCCVRDLALSLWNILFPDDKHCLLALSV